MQIPDCCYSAIAKSLVDTGFAGGVSKENVDELAHHYLDVGRLDEQIILIEKYAEIKGNFLEVGSGFGGLVTYLNGKYGNNCKAFGIEPSADSYAGTMACTKVLAEANGIHSRFVAAQGEDLPFLSNTFDIVYSTSVLEHVKNPAVVIAESIRVLKKGGLLQFIIPNYGSWWEGHYGVMMMPHMPKWLFKLYVKLLDRDPNFVDTLQFITRKQLEKILLHHKDEIEIISWGVGIWEKRLRAVDFSEWASLGKLKKWVRLVHRFKLVDAVIRIGKRLHWETPFVLTLRKNDRCA